MCSLVSLIRLEIAPEVVLNRNVLGRSSELQRGECQRTRKICKARLYIKAQFANCVLALCVIDEIVINSMTSGKIMEICPPVS